MIDNNGIIPSSIASVAIEVNQASGSQMSADTPLMRQFNTIKAQHPDALLLFRAGDFYETFGEDAVRASGILGITLTKRANGGASGVALAGFPYHALDTYLPKLVLAGERVAICEQLEDPKKAKGIVKRGVTELVTPGVTFHDNILSHKENSYLAAVAFGQGDMLGVSFIDISTGEFYVGEGSAEYVDKLMANFSPKEVVYRVADEMAFKTLFAERYYTYKLDDWAWHQSSNRDKLIRQTGVTSLKGFGIESMPMAITAAGAVLYYLEYTEHRNLAHIKVISRLDEHKYMWIDRYSIRNLEIFHSLSEGGTSLTDIIDRTASPMGARMLRRWLSLPLRDAAAIAARQDVVETLIRNQDVVDALGEQLAGIGDLERIIAKVAAGRVNPREVVQLGRSLCGADSVREICRALPGGAMMDMVNRIVELPQLRELIDRSFVGEPAAVVGRSGAVVAEGVDVELDELRDISTHGKEYLMQIQARESERTGISSLKISYNNVFGYYIEVRNVHKDKVPAEWVRKQTLVNAERYITDELKEYEHKILGAEERIAEIEVRIFAELVMQIQGFVSEVQQISLAVSEVDVLRSFACIARENHYCRAQVVAGSMTIDIKDGRHPVIEQRLPLGEPYVPNDVYLDDKDQKIIMITGPNMAGKSALLRQTALIVLMAQTGCPVPATSATIGVVDRIFTRVGASDNISQGESTFMVEMLESANILNNVAGSSLVLLDEIGRGTSTYDGISIAWAMVEFLATRASGAARTLFATHYHELNQMEEQFAGIRNYNVSVREQEGRVIFLRKLVPGGTAHSFGIHVAQIAGMPQWVVERSKEILRQLESSRGEVDSSDPSSVSSSGSATGITGLSVDRVPRVEKPVQMSFFQLEDPTLLDIRNQLKGLDVNNLTPLEALNRLSEIKKLAGL